MPVRAHVWWGSEGTCGLGCAEQGDCLHYIHRCAQTPRMQGPGNMPDCLKYIGNAPAGGCRRRTVGNASLRPLGGRRTQSPAEGKSLQMEPRKEVIDEHWSRQHQIVNWRGTQGCTHCRRMSCKGKRQAILKQWRNLGMERQGSANVGVRDVMCCRIESRTQDVYGFSCTPQGKGGFR